MATNPVASLPDADAVRAALRACELVDRLRGGARQRHRRRLPHPPAGARLGGEGRHGHQLRTRHLAPARRSCRRPARRGQDWWIVAEVARRLGFGEAFAWQGVADIFREHAALSAFENDGTRDFDIGAYAGDRRCGYEALAPFVWPAPRGRADGGRFFADGGFFHSDRSRALRRRRAARSPSMRRPTSGRCG